MKHLQRRNTGPWEGGFGRRRVWENRLSIRKLARRTLRQELGKVENVRVFELGRLRHAALGKHDSPASLIGLLADPTTETGAIKEPIIRALIAEWQESRAALWLALLVHMEAPMLVRLRVRILGETMDDFDLDQLILESFCREVMRYRLDRYRDRTFLRLRQKTSKRVFRHLAGRRMRQARIDVHDPEDFDYNLVTPNPFTGNSVGWRRLVPDPNDREPLTARLLEIVGDRIPASDLDLVIQRCLHGVSLKDLARDRLPEGASEADVDRFHQRLKRQLSRIKLRLRPLIESAIAQQRRA